MMIYSDDVRVSLRPSEKTATRAAKTLRTTKAMVCFPSHGSLRLRRNQYYYHKKLKYVHLNHFVRGESPVICG